MSRTPASGISEPFSRFARAPCVMCSDEPMQARPLPEKHVNGHKRPQKISFECETVTFIDTVTLLKLGKEAEVW